jgi:hypothetical protein
MAESNARLRWRGPAEEGQMARTRTHRYAGLEIGDEDADKLHRCLMSATAGEQRRPRVC